MLCKLERFRFHDGQIVLITVNGEIYHKLVISYN